MKILIASSIDPSAIAALEREHDVALAIGAGTERLRAAVADREVIVFRSGVSISPEVIDAAPGLRLLVRAGSGLDNVDAEHARLRGVRLVRVPGSSAQPVAELTFALLLAVSRNVVLADRLLRQASWPKPTLGGPLLAGKTLGIIGAGSIGSRVGEMGAAWGMRALGCVARPTRDVEEGLAARGITLVDFDSALTQADFLCLHVPLDETTYHMISEAELGAMKQGSFLINVARGGVVDEKALYEELTTGGRVAGAALDVHEVEGDGTESPLAELPNVVLTPHIGAMATDSQRLIGERALELIGAFEAGRLDDEADVTELVV